MINTLTQPSIPVNARKKHPAIQAQSPDEIPVDQVRVNPEQPRRLFDEQAMAELTKSVQLHGVLIPVLVERSLEGGYVLHDGERRWRAAQTAGIKTVPARILPPGTDQTKLVHALVANTHSASMTIVEEALAYQRLGEVYGFDDKHGSGKKIAVLLGLSPIRVYNALVVLKLSPAIQEYFAARKLPNDPNVVRALLNIPDDEARRQLAEHLAALPHPPTVKTVIVACTRLANSLRAVGAIPDRTSEKLPPARRYSEKKPRDEWPEWDALYQLGKVPPWQVVNNAIMSTCDECAMRPVASESTCRECPLVDCLRKMIKAVEP